MIYQKKIAQLDKEPSKSDGRDGEFYIASFKGSVYFYYKKNGEWYRTQMDKV